MKLKEAVLVAGLICMTSAAAQAESPPPPPPLPLSLLDMNNTFRADYKQAKQEELAKCGPIILLEGDNVVLINGSSRDEFHFVPPEYHILKAVDHIALGIFVKLQNHTDVALDHNMLADLDNYRAYIIKVNSELDSAGLPESILSRQKSILKSSLQFVEKVIYQQQVSTSDLRNFARHMTPPLMANTDDSVRFELDRLDGQIQTWRKQLPAEQWRKLYVVVTGGHMPRQMNTFMQYFEKLRGEKEEGIHIIYDENAGDESQDLDLIATHILDSKIGTAFFNEPMRMHRDLLSDSARKYLETHHIGH